MLTPFRHCKKGRDMMQKSGSAMGIGVELATVMVAPTLFGNWLDERYGTGKTWLLVGFAIGLIAAVRVIQRVMGEYRRQLKKAKSEEDTAKKTLTKD